MASDATRTDAPAIRINPKMVALPDGGAPIRVLIPHVINPAAVVTLLDYGQRLPEVMSIENLARLIAHTEKQNYAALKKILIELALSFIKGDLDHVYSNDGGHTEWIKRSFRIVADVVQHEDIQAGLFIPTEGDIEHTCTGLCLTDVAEHFRSLGRKVPPYLEATSSENQEQKQWKSKQDRQIAAIVEAVEALGFKPIRGGVPRGRKGNVKNYCFEKYPDLFRLSDEAFNHAWKASPVTCS